MENDRIGVSASTQYQQLIDRHANAIEFPIGSFIRYSSSAKKRPSMQALVKHRNEITRINYSNIHQRHRNINLR